MKKMLVPAAAMVVCSLALSLESVSQSSGSGTVTFRIAPMMNLSVWGESSSENNLVLVYTLPRPTAQERQAGFLERLDALKLVARSNVPWSLRVRAADPDMGLSDDGMYRKPVSDLAVRVAPSPYVPLATYDQTITRGPRGEHVLAVDYRVRLGAEHRDGNYRVTLIYTIASP